MQNLEPPENHYLNAAIGWLELGSLKEAKAEWGRIRPGLRAHPDVLEVWWQICAVEKNWQAALSTAEELLHSSPERPAGWICQSYSLHELKRTREAWDRLLPLVEKFPGEATIPYNLACYACQLGQLDEARRWLQRAIGIKTKFRRMALNDPDLKPLRDLIRKL